MALNQLQYLPRVDRIVVLRDGCVASVGTFAELLATSGTFADLMREFGMHDSAEAEEEAGELGDESDAPVRVHSSNRLRDALKKRTIVSPVAGETGAATTSVAIATSGASNAAQAAANVVSAAKANAALTEQVNAGTGAAESAYAVYSSAAGGYHVAALLVLMFVVHQCGRIAADWWLALWASGALGLSLAAYEGVFGGLGALVAVNSLCRSCFFAYSSLRAALELHTRMLGSIMRSPMAFYDTTPAGRIVNRFSADIDKVVCIACAHLLLNRECLIGSDILILVRWILIAGQVVCVSSAAD